MEELEEIFKKSDLVTRRKNNFSSRFNRLFILDKDCNYIARLSIYEGKSSNFKMQNEKILSQYFPEYFI